MATNVCRFFCHSLRWCSRGVLIKKLLYIKWALLCIIPFSAIGKVPYAPVKSFGLMMIDVDKIQICTQFTKVSDEKGKRDMLEIYYYSLKSQEGPLKKGEKSSLSLKCPTKHIQFSCKGIKWSSVFKADPIKFEADGFIYGKLKPNQIKEYKESCEAQGGKLLKLNTMAGSTKK
jgi:hypothetical protein